MFNFYQFSHIRICCIWEISFCTRCRTQLYGTFCVPENSAVIARSIDERSYQRICFPSMLRFVFSFLEFYVVSLHSNRCWGCLVCGSLPVLKSLSETQFQTDTSNNFVAYFCRISNKFIPTKHDSYIRVVHTTER